MDEPHDPLILQSPAAADEDLREQVQAMRSVLLLLLVAMTCVTAWLSFFLYRQMVSTNRQAVDAKRPIDEFQTNALPKINWFVNNLQAFARTNADFNPILAKYSRFFQTSGPAPAPPGTNALKK